MNENKPREQEDVIIERPIIIDNRCVRCGDLIPEGRQLCYICEHEAINDEKFDEI